MSVGTDKLPSPQITEHPFLFKPELVRSILEGKKTQTRRVVKPRNSLLDGRPWRKHKTICEPSWCDNSLFSPAGNPGPYMRTFMDGDQDTIHRIYSRVQPGDYLWCREAWRIQSWDPCNGELKIRYEADGSTRWVALTEDEDWDGEIFNRYWIECCEDMEKAGYRWNSADPETPARWEGPGEEPEIIPTRVRPSIHMPRWASRLQLEVTKIRPEPLQDITRSDIRSEGVNLVGYPEMGEDEWKSAYLNAWVSLWDSVTKAPFKWTDNPWVWVYEFQQAHQPRRIG